MRKRMKVLVGVALLAVGVLAVPALAQESPGAATDAAGHRLEVACARVPLATVRAEHALEVIQGDAGRRGSIAWLEARAEEARADGRDDLADLIEARIPVRTARIDVLEARLDWLQLAADKCAAR